jgi:hypothetical protein
LEKRLAVIYVRDGAIIHLGGISALVANGLKWPADAGLEFAPGGQRKKGGTEQQRTPSQPQLGMQADGLGGDEAERTRDVRGKGDTPGRGCSVTDLDGLPEGDHEPGVLLLQLIDAPS